MFEPLPSSRSGLLPAAALDGRGLAHQVTQRLRGLIIEGRFAPGDRLNERLLCEELGVSRTPLREALKVLAGEGLVTWLPNRGVEVTRLSESDIRHAFEVMGSLEGLSGRLACERITDEAFRDIKALHFEMLAAHARRDLRTYYDRNHAIHDAINAAAANPVLSATYHQLNARLQSLRFRSNFDAAKWDAAVAEHVAMMDALERRDGAAMEVILTQHLAHKVQSVLEWMRSLTT